MRKTRITTFIVALTAALAMASTGCVPPAPQADQVPDPSPSNTVAVNWGRDVPPTHANVSYGSAPGCWPRGNDEPCGASNTLDIYPATTGTAGTIIWVHGGAFVAGDKNFRDDMGAIAYQTLRGYDVVSVNYRLASTRTGANLFPSAVTDVRDALRWVHTNAVTYGLDTSRVVFAGSSAGATVAALAAISNVGGTTTRVDGWVSFAGIMDFNVSPLSTVAAHLWANQPNSSALANMSPVTHLDAGDPPGYLVQGAADTVVDPLNAHAMKNRARTVGANVQLDIVDRWANGSTQPAWNRFHAPAGGANLSSLNAFLDAL